jgi:purine-binding chemotaxis protein CheW
MNEYLTFHAAKERYALSLLQIREIVPLPPLTRVPSASPAMCGVFNLIGHVVPVIDLSMELGGGATAVHAKSVVVVTEVPVGGEPAVLGVLIDEIGDIVDTPQPSELLDLERLIGRVCL